MRVRRHAASAFVFVVAFLVREFRAERGNFVLWDEAHFGKFSQAYLSREFYFDVHPPLGKLLTALTGWLCGQSPSFLFSSSSEFPVAFDYAGMRRCHALVSAGVPLFAFLTLRRIGLSERRSVVGALLLVFENGMTAIGRLVLLDGHLLLFTAATVYYLTCWHTRDSKIIDKKVIDKKVIIGKMKLMRRIRSLRIKPTITESTTTALTITEPTIIKPLKSNQKKILKISNRRFYRDNNKCRYKGEAEDKNLTDNSVAPVVEQRSNGTAGINKEPTKYAEHPIATSGRSVRRANPPGWRREGVIGRRDWALLARLGLAIGCVVSVKWVGCLAMLLVGLYVASDLFGKLLRCRPGDLVRDFLQYAAFLILLPGLFYVALFALHFRLACRSGPDDGFVSTRFQLGLEGSAFERVRTFVSFGRQVTIRGGHGYLHSHDHAYPGQDALLQATTYGAKDSNNNYYFQAVTDDPHTDFLRYGDRVVLHHAETKSYLAPDAQTAYFSEGWRVSNMKNVLGYESVWEIRRVEEINNINDSITNKIESLNTKNPVRAVDDSFLLWNLKFKCFLTASNENYPAWGFNQGEVFCSKRALPGSVWSIEENLWAEETGNPLHRTTAGPLLRFVQNIAEHHQLMYTTNKSFAQNTDIEPERIVSHPIEWPLLLRGIRMSQWGDNHKFYMLMNPFVLYSSSTAILFIPLLRFLRAIEKRRRESRKREETTEAQLIQVEPTVCKAKQPKAHNNDFFLFIVLAGWFLHYAAFFCVSRVLYLHHYFPALFFAVLGLSYVMRTVSFRWLTTFLLAAIAVYVAYAPLTYGFLASTDVRHLRLFPSWDFSEE